VHHGNGTQAAFYDDPSVLYFSVHRYPFYPGSGTEAEKGRGKGLNHTINVPLPGGSGDKVYLEVFEQKLRPAALAFAPEFVFISAGFDAHENDTLGGMRVTTEGYGKLTRIVKGSPPVLPGRLVSVRRRLRSERLGRLRGDPHPRSDGLSTPHVVSNPAILRLLRHSLPALPAHEREPPETAPIAGGLLRVLCVAEPALPPAADLCHHSGLPHPRPEGPEPPAAKHGWP
jgi:hypothetical protein